MEVCFHKSPKKEKKKWIFKIYLIDDGRKAFQIIYSGRQLSNSVLRNYERLEYWLLFELQVQKSVLVENPILAKYHTFRGTKAIIWANKRNGVNVPV